MSIQTQIDRLKQAKADLISQITAKGVAVPADASLDDLSALVAAISTGGSAVTVHTGTAAPTADIGADGDLYLVVTA